MPYPGPNGALSPASPPGFVAVLTTARSRDVPAEYFDERLPRRLPHLAARVLALVFSLYLPRKLRRSHRAYWPSTMLLSGLTSPNSPERPDYSSAGASEKKL